MVIYKITNLLNEKIYIGQTKQPIERRFIQHSKADSPLGQAMRECGLENFTIEVIERCENQIELNEREKFWIKILKSKSPNGYNLSNGGGAGLHLHSDRENFYDKTMRLGEWIKNYRLEHDMSMQDMASICGFSKAYISMLEKGINPSTNKPVSPTMQAFEKIAKATGQDVDSLLKILDDEQPITIKPSAKKFSDEETKLIDGYRKLNEEDKNFVMGMIGRLSFSRPQQRMTVSM